MLVRFRKIYEMAPAFIRESVRLIPFAYRMGSAYRTTLRFLNESDRWSVDQYRAFQERQLGDILALAVNNIPYYARYRRVLEMKPFDALREIEPVTKLQIQSDIDQFSLPAAIRGRHHIEYTGGSSGYPLRMLVDDDAPEREWAFMVSQWMRAGYRPGDSRATFRGVEFRSSVDAIVRRNPVYNEIILSPFHLADEHLSHYVEAIRQFKPKFLRGYPSAITVLARFIDDNGIRDLPTLKALLCGSEGFSDEQRRFLERVFRAKFYSWYGMTEKVVLAGECEQSTGYHAFPQYGVTEILDARGNISSSVGAEGEVVGTGFINRVMPFIRYKLDDFASLLGQRCEMCGRNHIILSRVTGHRTQDSIVGRSGARISMTALNMHNETFAHVRQFQFHQKERGKVSLYLRVSSSFEEARKSEIVAALCRKTSDEIEYEIAIVDKIDSTGMGKGVYLRQELGSSDWSENS
jgi:phenylacetate-CoA ligase